MPRPGRKVARDGPGLPWRSARAATWRTWRSAAPCARAPRSPSAPREGGRAEVGMGGARVRPAGGWLGAAGAACVCLCAGEVPSRSRRRACGRRAARSSALCGSCSWSRAARSGTHSAPQSRQIRNGAMAMANGTADGHFRKLAPTRPLRRRSVQAQQPRPCSLAAAHGPEARAPRVAMPSIGDRFRMPLALEYSSNWDT